MLGGVLADFVRNPEIEVLPSNVQAGIRLHRSIDSFTDRHQIVHQSIGRISSRLGWFAGIVIDIYYDHILARNWERFASEPPLRVICKSGLSNSGESLAPIAPPDG